MSDVVGRAELELIISTNLNQIGKQLQDISKLIDQRLSGAASQGASNMEKAFITGFKNVEKAAEGASNNTGKSLRKIFDGVERAVEPVNDAISSFAKNTLGVLSTGAKVAGVAVAGLAASAIAMGVEFNKTQATVRGALKVIVPDKFEELLKAVNALNDESPFARQAFLELTQTLAGFGVEAEKIPPAIDAIQQAVAATGGSEADLLSLGGAFAKIASAGRLTGDIIQSFSTRGIDVLELLAEEANRTGSAIERFAGQSGAEIREQISNGALGAKESIEALTNALKENFGGATEEVRNTFSGASDRIRASLRNIGGDITKFFINPLGNVAGGPGAGVDAMNAFADALGNFRKALQPIINVLLPPLADGLRKVVGFIKEFSQVFVSTVPVVDEFGDSIQNNLGGPLTAVVGNAQPLLELFDNLKGFLPIVIGLVTKFGTSFLTQIPIFGNLLASLNPVAAALITVIAVLPEVREAFLAVGAILLPIVADIMPKLSDLFTALGTTLGPAVGGAVVALGAAFGVLLQAVGAILPIVTRLVELLEPFAPILTAVIVAAVGLAVAVKTVTTAVAIWETVTKAVAAVQAVLAVAMGRTTAANAALAISAGTAATATAAESTAALVAAGALTAEAAAAGAATTATSALATVIGILTAPITLIVVGVLALAAAVFLAYKRFQPFRDIVDSVGRFLAGVFIAALNGVRAAFSGLISILASVGRGFQTVFNFIKPILPILAAVAAISFAPLFVTIGLAIAAFKIFRAAIGFVIDNFNTIIGVIFNVISVLNPFIGLIRLVVANFDTISSLVSGAVSAAFNTFRGILDAILAPIQGLLSALLEIGRVVGSVLVNGLNAVISKFAEFGPIKFVIDGIRDAFGAVSDILSSVLDKVGKVKSFFGRFPGLGFLKDGKKDAEDLGKALDIIPPKFKVMEAAVEGFVSNFQAAAEIQEQINTQTDRLRESFTSIPKEIDPVLSALEKSKSAQEALVKARESEAAAGGKIRELEKQRARVLRDTISPAKEIAAAERDIAKARLNLAAIDRQVIATQKELNDFRAFGRQEQEAALERDVERAKIATNKARRDEQALLAEINGEKEKGNEQTRIDVNLAGLTLAQARNKLAAIRATLAAQQQGQKSEEGSTEEVKTQEQIEDEKRSARLDVLDAEQAQRDAERAHAGFRAEADAKEAELSQQIIDLNTQKIEQNDEINARQQHLNDLRNGETTLAKALKQIDEQIKDAKRAQAEAASRTRDAVRATVDAEREAARQAALFTGQIEKAAILMRQQYDSRIALLNIEPQVRAALERSLSPLDQGVEKIQALRGELATLNQQTVDQAKGLEALFNKTFSDAEVASGAAAQFTQENLLADDALPNLLLDAAHKTLAQDPNNIFAQQVRDIIQTLFAQRFSGFEKGGFIDGVGDGFGRVIRVAERGSEAVLPLTRPYDMARVMQDQRILNPVLRALGTITLPKSSAGILPAPASTVSLKDIRGSGGNAVGGRMQAQREQRDFAKMIAQELAASGFNGNVTVEAPITVEGQYNEELLARRIEDRIIKSIERRLK